MRDVLAGRADGDPDAALGFDVYVHRLCQGIAAMAASMGGLDLLVFTGGVGEHAAPVRAFAADGLAFLGVKVDRRANETASGRSEEHTSELQSLMRISYAVFCLKKKNNHVRNTRTNIADKKEKHACRK